MFVVATATLVLTPVMFAARACGTVRQDLEALTRDVADLRTLVQGHSVSEMLVSGNAILGSASAPVTMVQYSDFGCPFCGAFVRDTLPDLRRQYIDTGVVRLIFRHFPLRSASMAAARFGACAAEQDLFWPFHDAVFDRQPLASTDALTEIADELAMNRDALAECLRAGAPSVRQDMASATALRLVGTPAFVIGRTLSVDIMEVRDIITGAVPLAELEAAIDRVLSSDDK
jgi:protein-disulfide isomerase